MGVILKFISWCKICGNQRWQKLIVKITKNYTFEKIFLYGWEMEAFTFLGAPWNPCFELCSRAGKEAWTQLALTINSQSSFKTLRPSNSVRPFSVLQQIHSQCWANGAGRRSGWRQLLLQPFLKRRKNLRMVGKWSRISFWQVKPVC